ncbi:PREDICTED: E3 ubiquitin-protein ligase RNF185-like, partial [Wasmannia auropunctata]|uniref:E3 ubiquitin-protein ligase RNF185-like n=1 Tax=Wasmannia auropunctata TaxID=64793 RepID=UPI0005F06C9F
MTEEQQPGPSRSHCTNCKEKDGICKCMICFEEVKDAVSTPCGHLACWPCLHRWLEIKQVCPQCQNDINRAEVIRFFGCGATEHPRRNSVPPWSTRQRSEANRFDV